MNKSSAPKIAVIGCGHWGKNLVRNYAELGNLAAICDQDETQAAALSKQYNVPSRTFEDILEGPSIEAVVLATPAVTHAKFGTLALEKGKHIFVEKPLAVTVKDAEGLCKLARQKDKIIMVGHLLQYHAAFIKLKEMAAEGKLGTLQYIYSNRLSLGKIRTEENVLWSFAPHDISMILSLAGEPPIEVDAKGAAILQDGIHDTATVNLEFKNGIKAHIFVSWLHPYKEHKIAVVGDQGMACFDDTQPWDKKLVYYPHRMNWQDGVPFPDKAEGVPVVLEENEPLKEECRHFIQSVAQKKTPRTDGNEGLEVLKVLSRAQKCLDLAIQDSKQLKASTR